MSLCKQKGQYIRNKYGKNPTCACEGEEEYCETNDKCLKCRNRRIHFHG